MRSAKGWLFSINNIGMVLGAAVGGWLADRVGRKPVLLCAVAHVRPVHVLGLDSRRATRRW